MVPELEFKVGAHFYRARRMSVFDAFNIATDFRDVLLGLSLVEKQQNEKAIPESQFQRTVDVIMTMSRSSPPAVRERVLTACLSVVSRKQNPGWAPAVAGDGQVMFQDIGLRELSQITYHVLKHNGVIDFFSDGPTEPAGPMEKSESIGSPSREARTG